METLLNAEPVTSDQNFKDVRHFYDTTESHCTEPTFQLWCSLSCHRSYTSSSTGRLHLQTWTWTIFFYTQPRWSQDRSWQKTFALLMKTQEAGARPRCCYWQQSHLPNDCSNVVDRNARRQIHVQGLMVDVSTSYVRATLATTVDHHPSARNVADVKHPSICERVAEQPPTQGESSKFQTRLNPAAPLYKSATTATHHCSEREKLYWYRQREQQSTTLQTHKSRSELDSCLTVAAKSRTLWSKPRDSLFWNLQYRSDARHI